MFTGSRCAWISGWVSIEDESEEAALPQGYEPLLIADGQVNLADVIEDELILALPVVPLKPGEPLEWHDDASTDEADERTVR